MSDEELNKLLQELDDFRGDVKDNFRRLEDYLKLTEPATFNMSKLPLFRWGKRKW